MAEYMWAVWLFLIIAFVVGEIATVGLTSIWFAGGALGALLVSMTGLHPLWQFLVFVVVSVVLLCFTRPWALRYFKPRLVKTNFEENIGQNVCVTEPIDNLRGTGAVVCRGQEWTARAYVEGETFDAGTIVKVKEIRGVTMYVVKSEQMPERTANE